MRHKAILIVIFALVVWGIIANLPSAIDATATFMGVK